MYYRVNLGLAPPWDTVENKHKRVNRQRQPHLEENAATVIVVKCLRIGNSVVCVYEVHVPHSMINEKQAAGDV